MKAMDVIVLTADSSAVAAPMWRPGPCCPPPKSIMATTSRMRTKTIAPTIRTQRGLSAQDQSVRRGAEGAQGATEGCLAVAIGPGDGGVPPGMLTGDLVDVPAQLNQISNSAIG